MSEPLSDATLTAIEARAEAATEGPWEEKTWSTKTHAVYRVEDNGKGILVSTEADQIFIAHARTDIPLLLAEVNRLRTLIGEEPNV